MRFPPPEVVASWPAPNYVDPVLHRSYLFPINVVLIIFATGMVLLRLYARFFHTHSAGWDDYLVIAALPPAIGLTAGITLAANKYGWDRHIWDVNPGPNNENLVAERAVSWACQMLYLWSSSLTKLSLLVFYGRIFVTKTMRYIVIGFIIFTLGYFISFFLTLLLECRPLHYYWHILVYPKGVGGTCADESSILVTSGIINVFIDIVIFVMPIRTVMGLNIRLVQKLQVLGIFAAGITVLTSSLIRIVATYATTRLTYDVTWEGYLVWLWIGIEVDVGLICASLPACRSLLKVWSQKIHTSRVRFGSSKNTSSSASAAKMGIKKTMSIDGTYFQMDSAELNSQTGLTSDENCDHPKGWMAGTMPTVVSKAWAGDEEYHLEYPRVNKKIALKNLPPAPMPPTERFVRKPEMAFNEDSKRLTWMGNPSPY